MATFRKRGKNWQALIRKKGQPPITKSFQRKSDAQTWAKTIESELERGIYIDRTLAEQTIFLDVINRYEREVALGLKSFTKIKSRLKHLRKFLGKFSLSTITSTQLATYRDMRLNHVGAESIRSELGLINRILKISNNEWGIILPYGIPTVSKPKAPQGRDRRLQDNEEQRLIYSLHLNTEMQSIILFAIETAMRRGEIVGMLWSHIDLVKRTLCIPYTKTDIARTIPLSNNAVSILKKLPRRIDNKVFNLKPDSITQAFERACKRVDIQNLRFHDLRHEATSRLFEVGLNVMEVASITGHRDLRMLNRYTHIRPELLAKKLNKMKQ